MQRDDLSIFVTCFATEKLPTMIVGSVSDVQNRLSTFENLTY